MPKGNFPTEITVNGPINLLNSAAPTALAGVVQLYADANGELKAVQPSGGTVAIGTISSASETTIKAIAAADRYDGQSVVDLTNSNVWIFDAGSSASAGARVLVPDAGSGRWLRKHLTEADFAATIAEIDAAADMSAQTQAIVAPGAITVDGTIRRVTVTNAVNGAITLAAPSAAMKGKTLVIEYIGAGTQATTLALTEVQGGSAATTASFNAANETLVLVAGELKWTVLKEVGVTLS